jgi:hypothetical protein
MKLISPEAAQKKYDRGLMLLQEMQLHRIALGLTLIDLEETYSWKQLGFDSFPALCSAPLLSGGYGLRERTRQTTMQVSRMFVLELGVNATTLIDVPYSNLALVVSIVTKENVEEVLADARCLGNRDLMLNKKNGKYGGIEEPYNAENEPDPFMEICPKCHHKFVPKKNIQS